VLLLAGGLAYSASAAGASHQAGKPTSARRPARRAAAAAHSGRIEKLEKLQKERIGKLRKETWYWQRVMGVPPGSVHVHAGSAAVRRLAAAAADSIRRLAATWKRLERTAFEQAHHPPHLSAWLCIHRYEGSWTDPGAPYYGGLQMDLSFQQSYGAGLFVRKGTADHWSPLEQMWTAERAYRTRGFTPWPNTARMCGLL